MPGRRAGSRGAERCREGVALHRRRPAASAIEGGYLLQGRLIGAPGRLPFEYEVEARQPGDDRAGGVRGQVARLAGPGAAREVEIAVEPERADPGGVRVAVRANCAEEERDAGR